MNGVVGFFLGMMVAGGSGSAAHLSAFSGIPLRCLAAFDQSQAAYRECRRPSLGHELWRQYADADESFTKLSRPTLNATIDRHLDWEVSALEQVAAAAKKGAAK